MSILKDSISITCPPTSDDIVVDQLRVLHKPVKLSLFDTKIRPFPCLRIILDNVLCCTIDKLAYVIDTMPINLLALVITAKIPRAVG